jgi:hypothetical protein
VLYWGGISTEFHLVVFSVGVFEITDILKKTENVRMT